MNIEHAIKTQMQKAYWNLIKSDLENENQQFEHIILLINEIKERLKGLTLNNKNLLLELDEKIDGEFLKELFLKKYDISPLIMYIIYKLEKYCAPIDAQDIQSFKNEVINKMKTDIVYHEFLEYFIPKIHQKLDIIYERIAQYKSQISR